jgi:transcriptional regulator with XRE-family HTH domain
MQQHPAGKRNVASARPSASRDQPVLHPGPAARLRREASGLTLGLAAYRIEVDISRLSRWERAQGNLSLAERERLEIVLRDAVRERRSALDAALAVQHGIALGAS